MNSNFSAGLGAAGFPTSADIWLELDGRKVAVVQSYTCKTTRSSYCVEAFGEEEPVAKTVVEKLTLVARRRMETAA